MRHLREQFLKPDDEFSPLPFWFWNDELTYEELKRQIHDFRAKGINNNNGEQLFVAATANKRSRRSRTT